jgi:hypothetical protein
LVIKVPACRVSAPTQKVLNLYKLYYKPINSKLTGNYNTLADWNPDPEKLYD